MKFLMIGLGSIGQRHLRNIRAVCGDDAEIIAYRVRRLKTTFSDSMQVLQNVDVEQKYNVTVYTNLDEALAQKPDIAFISNVTNAHIPCAQAAAEAGCHIFLEKPISDSMDGVQKLLDTVNNKKLKLFVGFQNRYHPAIRAVKEYLDNNSIGEIVSVHSEVGERLTTMHSYEDYRTTYMARSDLGGGVILNQMVHELDYLRYLFGDMKLVSAVGGIGDKTLGIDVDDRCDAVMRAGDIPVSVHADFHQYPSSRFVEVVGNKGKIRADIINNRVTLWQGDSCTEIVFDNFVRNDMFLDELKSFLNCIEDNTVPEIGLADGIASLKTALDAKNMIIQNERD